MQVPTSPDEAMRDTYSRPDICPRVSKPLLCTVDQVFTGSMEVSRNLLVQLGAIAF